MPAQDELDTAKKQVQALTDDNKRLSDQVVTEREENKRNARYMAMEHAVRITTPGTVNTDVLIDSATKIYKFLLNGPTQTA